MILTFEFLAKYQSLPDDRPLVLLSLYCRVKKSFWLPHSLTVVDDQSGAYGVLEAADDCFKGKRAFFPFHLDFALSPHNTIFFSSDPHTPLHKAQHISASLRNTAKWLLKREQHREYFSLAQSHPTT